MRTDAPTMLRYPRTVHLAGSRLQPGDSTDGQVDVAALRDGTLVVEEKVDGANCAVSFSTDGVLWCQSRGHYLTGGPRERQFTLLKTWAACHQRALWEALAARYVMYGEWMQAAHTCFYDQLPHLFLEFDVLDRHAGEFLSTDRRRDLLAGLPVVSVPVLHVGTAVTRERLEALLAPTVYRSGRWRDALAEQAQRAGVDPARALEQLDSSDLAEGLYVKHERDGRVAGRYKWVRGSFLQAITDSGSHWQDRPIIPNQLAAGVDLFGP